jgi:hypothetical protein
MASRSIVCASFNYIVLKKAIVEAVFVANKAELTLCGYNKQNFSTLSAYKLITQYASGF